MLTLFLLSLALSVDGFAIAIVFSMQKRVHSILNHFSIAGCFSFFQLVMPLIGWMLGSMVQDFVAMYTNWIAFYLLLFTGLRMILGQFDWKAFYRSILFASKKKFFGINKKGTKQELTFSSSVQHLPKISWSSLLLLGFVTSLDALTVGVSYGLLQKSILLPACIIAFVTFFVTLIGTYSGLLLSKNIFIAKFSTMIGGMIIIGVAINGVL